MARKAMTLNNLMQQIGNTEESTKGRTALSSDFGTNDKWGQFVSAKLQNQPTQTFQTSKKDYLNPFGNELLDSQYQNAARILGNIQKKTGTQFDPIEDAMSLMQGYQDTVKASYALNGGNPKKDYLAIGKNQFDKALQQMVYKYQHGNDSPEDMRAFLQNSGYLGLKGTREKTAQNVIGAAKALGAGANQLSNINLEEIGDYVASYGAGNLSAEEKAAWESVPAQLRQQYVTDAHNAKKNPAYGQALRDWAGQQGQAAQNIALEEAEKYLSGKGWEYEFAKAHPGDLSGYADAFSQAGDIAKKAMFNGVDSLNGTEKEVYYALQGNNGPELGEGLLGMGQVRHQELKNYTDWGRAQADKLRAANGLYLAYSPTDEQRYVLSQYRNTPEGAREWAQDAAGTEEEQEAKENQWFVEKRAKFDDVPTMGNYEALSKPNQDFSSGSQVFDLKYKIINGIGDAKERVEMAGDQNANVGRLLIYDLMTDEERKRFNAMANDGKYSDAEEYLDFLQYDLNARANQNAQNYMQQLGSSGVGGAIAASVLSVPFSLSRGFGAVDVGLQNLKNQFGDYRPIDYNRAQTSGVIADAARQGVQDQVNWEINVLGQDVDLFDFLYGTAMSGLDSAAAGAMGAWPGAAVLGLGAAQNTMADLKQQGGNDRQVMIGGALAGAFETLFEHISIGKFYDEAKHLGKRKFGEHVKNILFQAGINFSEEFNTELADMIAEESVMGSKAQTERQRQEYIDLGMTEEEADKRIAQEKAVRLLEAGFGGALMGGAFGAISNVSSDAATSRLEKNVGKNFSLQARKNLAELASHMPDGHAKYLVREWTDSEGKTVPAKYNPEKATNKETGELYRAIIEELPGEMKDTVRANFVLNALDMMPGISTEAADAIGYMMSGEQLNPAQMEALARDTAGMELIEELFGVEHDKPAAERKAEQESRAIVDAGERTAPIEFEPMPAAEQHTEPAAERAAAQDERAIAKAEPGQGKGTAAQTKESDTQEAPAETRQEGPQMAAEGEAQEEKAAGVTSAPRKKRLPIMMEQERAQARSENAAGAGEKKEGGAETPRKKEESRAIMRFEQDLDSGGVRAVLEDGTETDAADLDLSDDQRTLAQEAAEMPEEDQGGMISAYQKEAGPAARDYARGYKNIYRAIAQGQDQNTVKTLYGQELTEEQRQAAMRAGQAAWEKEKAAIEKDTRQAAKQAKEQYGHSFRVLQDGQTTAGGVYLASVRKALTNTQAAMLRLVERIAEDSGAQVRVYDTLGQENGSYQTGSNIINVALDAEGGLLTRTVTHELYHYIKEWNAEAGQRLQDIALDALRKADGYDYDRRLEQIKRQYRDAKGQELSTEAVEEEMAAEAMLDQIGTEEGVRELIQTTAKTDATLLQKIGEWIKNTVAKLRSMMESLETNHPEVRALQGNVDYFQRIAGEFQTAAQTAGENFRAAQRGMNQAAAQDADIQRYQADMRSATTQEDAQAARGGLASAMFARYVKGLSAEDQARVTANYEDSFQRFQAAMAVFGGGQTGSLSAALKTAGLPQNAAGMNSVLAYAARQMAAGAREATSVKNGDGQERNSFKADQTETEEFKRWFGDSQVVNEDGTPKVVYHGADSEFYTFDKSQQGKNYADAIGGFFFTEKKKTAENYAQLSRGDKGVVMDVYLSLQNPYTRQAPSALTPIEFYDMHSGELIDEAQREGNDGIWIKGQGGDDLYIVFEPTQIKSATDNIGTFDPDNPDIRYELRGDTEADTEYMAAAERGDEEEAQRMVDEAAERSMAKSKIRDEDGRLMPVYHGTSESFTVFDMSKGRANMDIQGAFFSPWDIDAAGYGENVGRYYLDIKNPADEQTGYKALRRFQGQNEAGKKARNYLISQGYDGVNNGDEEFIAFYPEQIKLADAITYDDSGNVIPLSERFNEGNPDIRYELRGDTEADTEAQALEDVRADADLYSQIKQDEDARAALLMLRQLHDLTTQGGADALIKQGAFEKRLSEIARKIEEETGTKYGHNKLMAALRKVYQAMEQSGYNLGEILQYTRGIMQDVLEKAPGVLVEQDETTKEAIRILRTRPFYLSAEQKSEIAGTYGTLGAYTRKNFGKMKIRKQDAKTASLADVWREDLAPLLPGTFAEDVNELDMPAILDAWLENANQKKFAGEFGANIGAYATNQALNAMLDFYDVPGALKTKEEIRAGFQDRFNEQRARISQLQETARGAVDQARLQYEERYRNRIEKNQARKEETERKQKLRGQITRNVKAINTLNVSMTDAKHVPESMRAAALAIVEPYISDSGVFSGGAIIRLAHEYELLKQRAGEIGGFDEDILETINGLGERLNGRRLSQLTEQELQDLADITGNLRKIIADTNEAFVNGRKTTIDALSERLKQDMRDRGPARQGKAAEAVRALSYRETTPTYFADRVGGVIRDMIRDLYAGQNTWAFAMHNAKEFLGEDTRRKKSGVFGKYHVNDWINDKQHARFTTQHGDMIELNRQEAMSLYALWKRETTNKLQNANHLRVGGFMYDKGTRYEGVDTLRPHPLTESDMKMIRDYLTEEQKAFADEMVGYLSKDMAKIGNETSMRLYGYEKFKEGYYFPYDTDHRYLVGDLTQDGEQVKQPKSAGITKALMQNAATPITVKPFTEVWASHVNQMGLYAGFAEAIDTMSRVFNQRESGEVRLNSATGEETVISPESNWIEMEKALGAEGVKYLKTLARDVSGGVRADERSLVGKGLSLFKKGSVAGNLSVVLQQPTAYARAMMMVNPQYLLSSNPTKLAQNIKNMYKYSGVALIKDMGRFDTGTGKGAVEWMQDTIREDNMGKRALDTIDTVTGIGAEKADEWTWGILWGAIERETQHTRPDLETGTEEFYQAVADRFEDVVNHTQVYDSVLSKSEWMRSNTTMDKMVTSFMAEPTLTLNMLQDAIVNFRQNGGGKKVARAAATFLVNSALVALAKSIVTATRRKDDEGRTWLEKYLAEAAGNFADDVSPYGLIGMIPWARDVVSLLEGYSVERSDMDAIEQLVNAYKVVTNDNKSLEDKLQAASGAVGNIFGIPAKNVWRDTEAIIRNLFGGASANEPTTGRDIKYSVLDNIGLWDSSRNAYYDRMEEALKAGNMAKYNELRGYVEETLGVKEKTVTSGIKSAIQDSVKEGRIEDEEAIELLKLLDGKDEDEIDAYFQIKEWKQEKAHEDDEEYSYSRFEDVYAAVKAGQSIAKASEDLLAHEYSQDDIDSKILSQIGDWYKKGEISKEEATRKLKQYNDMDDADDLYFQFQKWEYEKNKAKRDPAYNRFMKVYDAVDTDASATAAIKELTSHGYSDESVKSSIKNHIGEMYREGDITKAQATARLRKYAGVTDSDDLHWAFDEWDYNTGKGKKDPDYNRYIDVYNAVDKGQSISTAMREMTQNGYEEKEVKSKIKSHIGEQYQEGTLSKSKAESKLKQYAGITDSNDMYWVFDEWDYNKKNANNKSAPKYSRYLAYDNAVKTGSKLTEETNRMLNHGVKKDTISDHITKTFKPEYVALVKAGRTKEAEDLKYRLLTAYERAGYDRTKKNKDIAAWLKEKKQ